MRSKVTKTLCPCGSGLELAECCGPVIDGSRPAPNAEALMRSRYSAYALGREDWLNDSWHPQTRPAERPTAEQRLTWLGLKLIKHRSTGDNTAEVEFIARYRSGGRGGRLHETSQFVKEQGRWLYVDGIIHHN